MKTLLLALALALMIGCTHYRKEVRPDGTVIQEWKNFWKIDD